MKNENLSSASETRSLRHLERLKRMYGEAPPRDSTTQTLARITMLRLKSLAEKAESHRA